MTRDEKGGLVSLLTAMVLVVWLALLGWVGVAMILAEWPDW